MAPFAMPRSAAIVGTVRILNARAGTRDWETAPTERAQPAPWHGRYSSFLSQAKRPPMPVAEDSILLGKSHRTPDEEVRDVRAIDNGGVIYLAVPHPGAGHDCAITAAATSLGAEVEGESSKGGTS